MLAESAVSTCTLVAFAIHAAVGCCLHHAHTSADGFGFVHAGCDADLHNLQGGTSGADDSEHESDDHPNPGNACDEGQCSYVLSDSSAFELFEASFAMHIWADVLERSPEVNDGSPVRNLNIASATSTAPKLRALLEVWRL